MAYVKKKIILGVTAGIAAYKAAILVRLLIKEGCQVKVLMTPLAKKFITPLTLATLSKNSILVDFFDPETGSWNSHVDLGLWADAYLIAPATANSIAKMANGIADNLLLTTYLSARCPVFFAPTMDLDMYKHPATQQNINKLIERKNYCIEPDFGELASGLEGKGRMAEPQTIVDFLKNYFFKNQDFLGKNVLITAGPTYEHLDPVRFIGNHSSGKMGFALAEELANRGAQVTIITGPVNLELKNNSIVRIDVISAQEMYKKATEFFPKTDIAILAAAVADYAPIQRSTTKIKKNEQTITITLKKNPDIAKKLGEIKNENQILVGFALETNDEKQNAVDKLNRKNFDFIVLNTLRDKGAGFGYDTNKISILDKKGNCEEFELKNKTEVAIDIVNKIKKSLK